MGFNSAFKGLMPTGVISVYVHADNII